MENDLERIGKVIEGKTVEVVKNNKEYSLKDKILVARKANIYKAYLSKVVDGDTIRVIFDLGFNILHEEIIRFRGINAAERETLEGQKSSLALKNILKKSPFLIIKTTATDMYGRYVADVFLADEGESLSPQQVADKGVYLNQMLLDEGLAMPY